MQVIILVIQVKVERDVEDREDDGVEDPVDRFLNMIDWGNVQKPQGWDEQSAGGHGEFDDAEDDGGIIDGVKKLDMSQP